MHITVDPDRCIGAAHCVTTAPDVFDQGEDGVVVLLKANPHGTAEGDAKRAAYLCPGRAIRASTESVPGRVQV